VTLILRDTDIYIASRTLYGLSSDGYASRIFQRTHRHVPLYAVGLASVFFLVAFLNVSDDSTQVFKYLVSVSTVLGLINWINILLAHLGFCYALRAQGISRDLLPFSGRFMVHRSMITLFFTCVIVLFNGKICSVLFWYIC
jgi:amino acid transporter